MLPFLLASSALCHTPAPCQANAPPNCDKGRLTAKLLQFTVIFHNRQTTAEADALHGVTMEKRGISKIVSMRFRSDLEKDSGGR